MWDGICMGGGAGLVTVAEVEDVLQRMATAGVVERQGSRWARAPRRRTWAS